MLKVLYICTHNRCRSILSEAITNHIASGKINACSAGSQPAGEVHPLTIEHLNATGISTAGLRSQSWDDLADFKPDVVITVCDSAAREACPVWFGNTLKLHWELSDPSKLDGTHEEKAQAFRNTIDTITERVYNMLALSLETKDSNARRTAMATLDVN